MYQVTTAASIEDFINKLATAAALAGWTVHRNTLVGALRTITLRKSGDYVHVWNTDQTGVKMRGSVGYDGALAASAQPNQAAYTAFANTGAGPFASALFFAENTPAEHLYAVLEVTGGKFRHFGMGMLAKTGAYIGGTFYDCTHWQPDGTAQGSHIGDSSYNHRMFDSNSRFNGGNSGAVRCDVDSNASYFAPFYSKNLVVGPVASGGLGDQSSSSDDYNNGDGFRSNAGFYQRSINGWSGQTPLQRIQVRIERPGGFWSVIGEAPGIRYLNMARFAPGEEFTIASDTYKVFPWLRQGDSPGGNVYHQYSQHHAYAFVKVG